MHRSPLVQTSGSSRAASYRSEEAAQNCGALFWGEAAAMWIITGPQPTLEGQILRDAVNSRESCQDEWRDLILLTLSSLRKHGIHSHRGHWRPALPITSLISMARGGLSTEQYAPEMLKTGRHYTQTFQHAALEITHFKSNYNLLSYP